jgi:large subunit ribosomal protein L6
MSRVGKKPIVIPEGVTAQISGVNVSIKGPKGSITIEMHPKVSAALNGQEITVSVKRENDKRERALWGLTRALINNMVVGVTSGFTKVLEITGVGYKAQITGKKLVLSLGYSHPVEMEVPEGLETKVERNTITITGIDRQKVGQFAAVIREQRPPEPYKGKGIRYSDEVIRRKAGKVVKAVGGGK